MAAKFFGQFLLEQGLIGRQQLLDAIDAQRASNPLLGELAVAAGMLDAVQAERVNQRQRVEDRRFGDIAQAMGLLDASQVETLLGQQKSARKLLGEVLVEQGALERAQLDEALQAHRQDREQAVEALVGRVDAHASGTVMNTAIDTCVRLFPRLLRTQCQFSSLVESPDELGNHDITAYVRIQAERPLLIAVACDRATAANIAGAFLSMPPASCDDALSQDALGELVNVLMGYLVKDTLAEDADYQAAPPEFDLAMRELLVARPQALAVSMASQLGPFALLVGG